VTDDVKTAKRALRQRIRARRRTSDRGGTDAADLARRVATLTEVAQAEVVAAYVSVVGEPPTGSLLEALAARGVRVLLPVVLPDLDLDWALDDGTRHPVRGPGGLEPGGPRLGRDAIATADVVIVPALAVDTRGGRLGQGGASYDRALTRTRAGVLVVALLHDDELLSQAVPTAEHDRPVDAVVTPRRVVRLLPRLQA